MKKTAIILASLALTACGESGPDFDVGVRGDAAAIKQELAQIAGSTSGIGGVAPIALSSEGDSLVFTVPAKDGYDPGRIKMDFSQGEGITKVAVTVDMPMVPMGDNMVLSEEKVEFELRKALKIWGSKYGDFGTAASRDTLEANMAAVAIAAQGADTGSLFYTGGTSDWAAGSTSDWDEASYDDGTGWGADSGADDYYADDGGWGAGS